MVKLVNLGKCKPYLRKCSRPLTGNGRLQQCVNTEFLWEQVQTPVGFCQSGLISELSAYSLRECLVPTSYLEQEDRTILDNFLETLLSWVQLRVVEVTW